MKNKRPNSDEQDREAEKEGEKCDMEVWNTLSNAFRQAQFVLDHNRSLIQQVNQNQQSMISDNLAKNVSLIREINGNISRVISIYSDLSSNFSNAIRNSRDAGGIDKAGNADSRNYGDVSQ